MQAAHAAWISDVLPGSVSSRRQHGHAFVVSTQHLSMHSDVHRPERLAFGCHFVSPLLPTGSQHPVRLGPLDAFYVGGTTSSTHQDFEVTEMVTTTQLQGSYMLLTSVRVSATVRNADPLRAVNLVLPSFLLWACGEPAESELEVEAPTVQQADIDQAIAAADTPADSATASTASRSAGCGADPAHRAPPRFR